MSLDVVRGRISNINATNELVEIMEKQESVECSETLYLGYPLSANMETNVTVDALLLSEKIGLVAFIFSGLEKDTEGIIEEQGELYFQLTNTLTQYPSLRKGRSLAFEPCVISITPHKLDTPAEDGYILTTFENLPAVLSSIPAFDTSYYHVLVESLQKLQVSNPEKNAIMLKALDQKAILLKK